MTPDTPSPARHQVGPPPDMVAAAVRRSMLSPCRSKRGVAVFDRHGLIVAGYNHKPEGFSCDGSAACKATCRDEAIHAEQDALLRRTNRWDDAEMLHVKTVDGALVASGGPSCVQCSKMLMASGLSGMWLYGADGWRRYGIFEFHRLSLAAPVLPPLPGVRERLAVYAHEAWSGWMRHLFGLCPKVLKDGSVVMPAWAVRRWRRQSAAPYADLPPEEQESDRVEADRILAIMAPPPSPERGTPAEPMLHDPGFTCPECGPHVKADEDGCCALCGRDCNGDHLVAVSLKLKDAEQRLTQLTKHLETVSGYRRVAWGSLQLAKDRASVAERMRIELEATVTDLEAQLARQSKADTERLESAVNEVYEDVLRWCLRAWHDGNPPAYLSSPLELIAAIIDERDEFKAKLATLAIEHNVSIDMENKLETRNEQLEAELSTLTADRAAWAAHARPSDRGSRLDV